MVSNVNIQDQIYTHKAQQVSMCVGTRACVCADMLFDCADVFITCRLQSINMY